MKCPYCSNEIPNNSTECEVCGVNLEEPVRKRNANRVFSIICLIFGSILLLISFVELLDSKIISHVSNQDMFYNNLSVGGLAPFIAGLAFAGFGIFGVITNKDPKSENNRNNMTVLVISIIIMVMYIVVTGMSIGTFASASKRMGSYNPMFIVFMIPSIVIPVIVIISVVAAIMRGKK